jgi:nitroreductase
VDTFQCIAQKLDLREFSQKPVPTDIVEKVLEAGRLTGSGSNLQHWRFVLVREPANLRRLSKDSKTGKWVAGANFAVIILTDPKYGFHLLDAGRVVQDMELAAWNYGVGSGIFTGMDKEAVQIDFEIPRELTPSAVLGFGYPARKIKGRKDRAPLTELTFSEKYGQELAL